MFWFKKEKKFVIEAFGKLPFYKDYISVVASKEAAQWKAWLLNNAGKDKVSVPKGFWPFAFHFSAKSNLLVGLIQDSSDGIREFPFSVFTVCKGVARKGYNYEDTICGVWEKIYLLHHEICDVGDISRCYDLLRNKNIVLENRKGKRCELEPFDMISNDSNDYPRLFISTNIGEPKLHLLSNSCTPIEKSLEIWRNLVVMKPTTSSGGPG